MRSENHLFRYTNLASALDTLENRRLTLLPPSSWSDKNDSGFMEAYRDALGLKSLGALCFTDAFETSQHWNLFAEGMDGVRIEFRREVLEADVAKVPDAEMRQVQYLKIEDVDVAAKDVGDWPYLKRLPYQGESEIRAVYASATDTIEFPEIPISESAIRRITLSPDLPKSLRDPVSNALQHAAGFDVKVARSTLNENSRWLKPVLQASEEIQKSRQDLDTSG